MTNRLCTFILRQAVEALDVSANDFLAASNTEQAFLGISFLDRKLGSDSNDRHSAICLSLESSLAVIMYIFPAL